ncbi:MAG: transglutaminase [Deltaproteobacteria bacterium]|nr:transglutaminase [Deltaproteobacteria bacterium]
MPGRTGPAAPIRYDGIMDGRSLDDLPRRGAFRLRGLEMTRIETFTDAAFAFAVTLLVISIDHVPTSLDELERVLREIPAFAISFMLLALFWWGHHTWSQRYGLHDGVSIALSLLLVFLVLCYVYPLRFLFGTFMNWITDGWASPAASSSEGRNLDRIFVIYGVGYAAMSGCICALNLHAWRLREVLQLDERELVSAGVELRAWAINGGVALLSIALALLGPETDFGLPGWVYLLLAVLLPLDIKRTQRSLRE